MGTNYYAIGIGNDINLHIGKTSAGWKFLFQTIPDQNLFCFTQWCEFLRTKPVAIFDEYQRPQNVEDFIQMVKNRQDNALTSENMMNYLDKDGYNFSWGDFS